MEYRKYIHLERWGTTEVSGIDEGLCYVFPKIDGTNAVIFMQDGKLKAGSRKRELTLDADNAGFYAWVLSEEQSYFVEYFLSNPTHILYGEFLVPHSLKTYRETAWRKFYCFDVYCTEKETFLHFEDYAPKLEEFGIEYIPPIAIVEYPTYERIVSQLQKNDYLIEDGKGVGEGVVVKNYGFTNKYGRVCWAKIVSSEFKEKHAKTMGAPTLTEKKMVEQEIVDKYVTQALCEKVFAKIEAESGFSSKNIPQLLNIVYYDLVREDCWNFVKEHKNPKIDFRTLQSLTFRKVKDSLPQLF
jgi:hypothetical protein